MIDIGGFWISPEGTVHKVRKDHYQDLEAFPSRFGLKKSQVKGKEHEELYRLAEGLIRGGWIRARDRGLHGWIFQVGNIEEQLGAVAEILSMAQAGAQETVNISSVGIGNPFYIGDVSEVFSGEILKNPRR